VWDAEPGATLHVVRRPGLDVESASFSPDGSRLAIASGGDRTVRIVDAATYAERARLQGHEGNVFSASFSADGKRIATASGDRTVRVWDAATGRSMVTLRHDDTVFSAVFSPDGDIVASGDGARLRLWNVASGAQRDALDQSAPVYQVVFFPDGSRLVFTSGEVAHVLDVKTRRETAVLRGHRLGVLSAAISADGGRVATGGLDFGVRIWDASSGAVLSELPHSAPVSGVAFSPDGARLAAGYWDGTVLVWDLRTGRYSAVLRGHEGRIQSLAFSPDGRVLISAAGDRTARLWRVPLRCQLAIDAGRAALPRQLSKSDREQAFLESSIPVAPPRWIAFAVPRAGEPCE
jgi:WD40 repeat protein